MPVAARSTQTLAYQHSGFSVDAGVCVQAHDRAAFAIQGCGGDHGFGGADSSDTCSACANGRGRAWGGAAG